MCCSMGERVVHEVRPGWETFHRPSHRLSFSKRLQHGVTDVADLDTLVPVGVIGDEAGVQFGQRLKLPAVLNIRSEHCH